MRRPSNRLGRLAALTGLLMFSSCANYSIPKTGSSRAGRTAVQALIGATEFHKLTFERQDPSVPSDTVEADLSTMPAVGIAGQYAIGGSKVEVGMDGGLLFNWDSDGARFISTGSGTVVFVDRSLLVVDLFFGPYISTIVADRVRLYGAAGASLMFGDSDYRDEFTNQSDSAFGVGVYARAGAEIRLVDSAFLGLGVRWVSTVVEHSVRRHRRVLRRGSA